MLSHSKTERLKDFPVQVARMVEEVGTPLNFEIQATAWYEGGAEYVTINIFHAGGYRERGENHRFADHPYLTDTCCGPTWSCELHKTRPPVSGTMEQRMRNEEFT